MHKQTGENLWEKWIMSQNPINRRDFLKGTLTTLWTGFLTACDIKTEVPLTNTPTLTATKTVTPSVTPSPTAADNP